MKQDDCVPFLQRALPRLRMRWRGFRRVSRQVTKRVERRVRDLGLTSVSNYESYLESHPGEWEHLDALCRITISRFYRDRAVGDHLRDRLLPDLCDRVRKRDEDVVRCWSVGCGSGEEPYTISLIWHLEVSPRFPDLGVTILGTDADNALLDRAETAVYKRSSLKDLPYAIRRTGFDPHEDEFQLRAEYQQDVEFRQLDVRRDQPEGPFDLVLCRNLVFTYFDETLQRELLSRIADNVVIGGALVIGIHEQLPPGAGEFAPVDPELGVYRRAGVG
jgi:chemotaxis protein methyltransferase CheR